MKQLLIPEQFYNRSKNWAACCAIGAAMFLSYGILAGLFIAPLDYQQGAAVKIIYVHVPCALLSLSVYTIIGCMSFIYLIWKIKLADIIAQVSAPFGASMAAVALVSGAFWGKPMWGTWWVWDARLTSELILLFIYLGYMGLRSALRDAQAAASSCAILALVGLIDIPIIHYSVNWWHTLHQAASISRFARPAIAPGILYPLLSVMLGLYLLYLVVLFLQARNLLLWRERNSKWVRGVLTLSKGVIPERL